ncbi:MAG TPA: hypothetical protein PKM78_07310 [Anaerolineae bacterium]|nr:hypothetical protein [Anaerolineae bacterium]
MTKQTVTLDEAIVVSEKLPPLDRLRLIGILSNGLCSELKQDAEPVDMLSLAGLGAEIWQAIDVTQYLEQERVSWDRLIKPSSTTESLA